MSDDKPYMNIDLDVLHKSYGWTIDIDGQVCGLVAGDMGYDETGIFIPMEHILAMVQKDHEKIEDTPGYKAGFSAGIDKAAMIHVMEAHRQRQWDNDGEAHRQMNWVRRIRELDEPREE